MKDGQPAVVPSAIKSTVEPLYVKSVPNWTDAFIFGTSHNSEEMEMAVRYWLRLQDPDLYFDRIWTRSNCDKCTNVVRDCVGK